ncbi:MAG: hypothetical protein J5511_00940 [Bacilli bacterium]|nr:hypothetical protein [Bacilli bacterium]
MNKKLFLVIPFVLLTLGCNNKPEKVNPPKPEPKTYTVTWTDYTGEVLEVDENVEPGTMPEYNGTLPTREATARYTYAFKAWSPQLTPVERNVTYMATYSATVNTYTITWKNYDGSVIKTDENVPYGTDIYYTGDQPERENTESKMYYFSGWDPEPHSVTGDQIYTAVFEETARRYFITWKDWQNRTLKISSVAYGDTPSYDGAISLDRPDDDEYTYTFIGWSPEIVPVTESTTYTAQYSATPKE